MFLIKKKKGGNSVIEFIRVMSEFKWEALLSRSSLKEVVLLGEAIYEQK